MGHTVFQTLQAYGAVRRRGVRTAAHSLCMVRQNVN